MEDNIPDKFLNSFSSKFETKEPKTENVSDSDKQEEINSKFKIKKVKLMCSNPDVLGKLYENNR